MWAANTTDIGGRRHSCWSSPSSSTMSTIDSTSSNGGISTRIGTDDGNCNDPSCDNPGDDWVGRDGTTTRVIRSYRRLHNTYAEVIARCSRPTIMATLDQLIQDSRPTSSRPDRPFATTTVRPPTHNQFEVDCVVQSKVIAYCTARILRHDINQTRFLHRSTSTNPVEGRRRSDIRKSLEHDCAMPFSSYDLIRSA